MERGPAEAKEAVRLIPLGGLGEFGLNALVLEWEDHLLLIDAGMLFPTAEMPGVDSIVPDFEYLAERRGRVRGILLTHGHEDHIGALSYALQAAPVPVYGSRLTLGFARRRLVERGIKADLRTLRPGEPVEIGPFRVHPIRVAHSVLDSLALAIETPAGVVLASGDFKLDPQADPAERTDLETLSQWGDRGVLVLLSDSTNVEVAGSTPGESTLVPAFEEIAGADARARARLLLRHLDPAHRDRGASSRPRRAARSAFLGRRMVDNAETALELGLLAAAGRDADRSGVAARRLRLARARLRLGQPGRAAFGAVDDQPRRAPRPRRPARATPSCCPRGRSRATSAASRASSATCSASAATSSTRAPRRSTSRATAAATTSSSCCCRTRPRYLVPVHGEYRMLAQHQRLAVQAGLPADRVLLAEDGDVLSVSAERRAPRGPRRGRPRAARPRRRLGDRGRRGARPPPPVVRGHRGADRRDRPAHRTARVAARDRHARHRGRRRTRRELADEAGRLLAGAIDGRPVEERLDAELTRERVRDELRRFFKRRTQRRPMVIPVVMEV